jgi:hypothetical protein
MQHLSTTEARQGDRRLINLRILIGSTAFAACGLAVTALSLIG